MTQDTECEGTRPKSVDLTVGQHLRYSFTGKTVRLDRRKDDNTPLPGWWLSDGTGLADCVIDDPDSSWQILRP